MSQLELLWDVRSAAPSRARRPEALAEELERFCEFGTPTLTAETPYQIGEERRTAPAFINEFWTAKQRAAHGLHEISYRACFKPQLPRFFIERLTAPGEVVYDPFMGRGTTLLEAALLGRVTAGCDVNPLSRMLIAPRLNPPSLDAVAARLKEIDFTAPAETREDLSVFYHPETLREICALRSHFLQREAAGQMDAADRWIRMVAVNRLTGHSPGFFSVYTLPPNQAVSVESQVRINRNRSQTPPRRDVAKLILKKSKGLLKECTARDLDTLRAASREALLLSQPCQSTPQIASDSVALAVTSPPFLNIVNYATDNWLRCWFCGLDLKPAGLTVTASLGDWMEVMTAALRELRRVLRPGGHVAFEVGEVRKGSLKLEESVLSCGVAAGLDPLLVVINDQEFTKTSNCWGVSNRAGGTNTNRIVVFQKRR